MLMKRKTKIILIVILMSLISTINFANYRSIIFGNATAKIKYPIFLLNSNELVEKQISSII